MSHRTKPKTHASRLQEEIDGSNKIKNSLSADNVNNLAKIKKKSSIHSTYSDIEKDKNIDEKEKRKSLSHNSDEKDKLDNKESKKSKLRKTSSRSEPDLLRNIY